MKAKSWKKCLALTAMVSMISVMPSYAKADYYVDPAKPYDAPIHGMFHNQPVRSEVVGGEYSVYIPETLPRVRSGSSGLARQMPTSLPWRFYRLTASGI